MFLTHFLFTLALSALANSEDLTSNETSVHHHQHLKLPFESRSLAGQVSVTIQPNNDASHAFGLDLFYPGYNISQFQGFPVVHGEMTYPIPSSLPSGYGSLFGWIQFVREEIDGVVSNWTLDHYPYAMDIRTPFTYWGYNPSLFDAPAISWSELGNGTSIVWTAQVFLTVLEDAGLSKNVSVIPGGAFTWGFDLNVNGEDVEERKIVVRNAEKLDLGEWSGKLPGLREMYADWMFQDKVEI